jgi:hypothetical protein
MKLFSKIIYSAIFSLISFSINAQHYQEPVKENTVFFELLGNGGYYSFNYDRIMASKEKWKLAGRIGGSYINHFNDFNTQYINMPLELSFLSGKGPNYLEIGMGATYIFGKSDFGWPGEEKTTILNFDLMIMPRIGYRYQKPEGGPFFKIGFTPIYYIKIYTNFPGYPLGHTSILPLFGGIAVGHTFR